MTDQPNLKKVSRLSKKDVEDCATSVAATIISRTCGKTLTNQIFLELLEYKSIEEQLGIDLVTYFKAMVNGVYYDAGGKTIKYHKVDGEHFIDIDIQHQMLDLMYVESFRYNCYLLEMSLKTYDYGKTWALTKEELE